MFFSHCSRAGLLAGALLLATPAVRAQGPADTRPTQDPFGHPLAPEVPPGRYKSHRYQNGVLTVYATDGSARQVQPWAAGVIKISYFAPGRLPVADSSVSVVQAPVLWRQPSSAEGPDPGMPAAAIAAYRRKAATGWMQQTATELRWTVSLADSNGRAGGDGWGSNSKPSTISINKQTLRISLLAGNDTLLTEASPAFRRRPRVPVGADDATPPGRADELAGTGVRIQLQPGERLYGTGARALPLDRRGYRLELYNQAHYGYQNGEENLNVALPVVLSSRGYLLLFDHYAAGYLDLGKKHADALEYGVQGLNSLSYFVITGQSQGEILQRYTALTGRQPLPPRWALGLIQSRFGYRSQTELLDVARRMQAADFPLDALVLDLYWFGGTTRQGDFQWDARYFPDPAGMMRALKQQGVKTILISEPYVMRTSLNDSLVRTQSLVGTTAAGQPYTVGSFWAGPASILDVFRSQTRSWLWAQYRRLREQGAAGWWSDLGEPENHPLPMHHALGTTAQVHNAYGITWAGILQAGYAREYPQERLFNLARSGWAGMQRNSVFPWSGDINRSWSGLRAQVPIMLGMGQAGVGYMHSDAGGFGANARRDPELYTRWLQLAALCPIMRPHSDQVVPPEPYTYPEPYRSIVRHYAHLRYELLPYLYTLAAENTLTGAPLTRALDYYAYGATAHRTVPARPAPPAPEADTLATEFTAPYYEWSQQPRFISKMLQAPRTNIEKYGPPPPGDEYLLGNELLVAPVSEPGQRRRNVRLPQSMGGWVDFETGRPLPDTARLVGLPAPLGHMPLLARAGAIVPVAAYRSSTAAYRPDTLGLRFFPAANSWTGRKFTVYEDDGHSAQALAQVHFVAFEVTTAGGDGWGSGAPGWGRTKDSTGTSALLTIRRRGGYPGQPASRYLRLEVMGVANTPTQILRDEQPLAASAWSYNATRHMLTFVVPMRNTTTLTFPGVRLLTAPATGLDPDAVVLQQPESREFSQQATLRYERFGPGPAFVRILGARGESVRSLPVSAAPGTHTLVWDGRDALGQLVPAGVYAAELGGQHQLLVRLPE